MASPSANPSFKDPALSPCIGYLSYAIKSKNKQLAPVVVQVYGQFAAHSERVPNMGDTAVLEPPGGSQRVRTEGPHRADTLYPYSMVAFLCNEKL